jgi:ABC-2 type transport system permease protein
MVKTFSWQRLFAMIMKEFVQIKRDRGTFAMIVGIPIMQIILFGYAINSDPKHLPTAILGADNSIFTRTLIKGLVNTSYFKVTEKPASIEHANHMLKTGQVQFIIQIPPSFTQELIKKRRPSLLLEADATDPSATGNAIAAAGKVVQTVLDPNLNGPLQYLKPSPPPVNLIVHTKYNPEVITQYNILPGLTGVVLTMTMVMITSIAITREKERGTIENLLATLVQPFEVMVGKIVPYIIVGYVQILLMLLLTHYMFAVPIEGSITILCLATFPFIAANLAVGLAFSALAKNQLQATQMTVFFFLPSILLSGFMFPFRGMPTWAQAIGETLPLTHFLRIARGLLLKGFTWPDVWTELWPILIFMSIAIWIGVKSYHKTLD